MSVKAKTEKNFRRAKVQPVKKRAGRAWLSWRATRVVVACVLAVYAGYRAVDMVLSAATLKVQTVTVSGHTWLSEGEVQALLEGLEGTSILTADLTRYRARLLDSPWVADAALRRVLPSTVEVLVSERSPIGLCRLGSDLYLLDRDGMLIDEFGPQYADFDLPIIDGIVRHPSSGNSAIDERRAALAARVIDAVAASSTLAPMLSQIDVRDLNDAVVMLKDDTALLHLGTERFAERLQGYVDITPALRERVAEMDYVDLRYGERLFVKPVGKMPGAVPAGTR